MQFAAAAGAATGQDRMWRAVVIGVGTWGAWKAGKAAVGNMQEHATSRNAEGNPMQIIAKGATCLQSQIGPWGIQDLTLGLACMAKVNEKKPPQAPGQPAKEESQDAQFLKEAQHWRSMAEAVYVPDSGSFSILSHLPESAIVGSQWEPDSDSLRPAYAVCVDAAYGAIVLAVRGTSHVLDMLLNSGAQPEDFHGGIAHGGFAHASEVLCKEVQPLIDKAFEVHGRDQKDVKLVIVGHSMGAAVGIMSGLNLRDRYKDLECWGYAPPACLSLELAEECASFSTCFLGAHDLIPRFSIAAVEKLRQQVCSFDWDEAEKVAHDDEDWKNLKKAIEAMRGFQRTQKDVGKKAQQAQDGVTRTMKEARQNVCEALPGQANHDKQESKGQQNGDAEGDHDAEKKSDESSKQGDEKKDPPRLYAPGKLYVLACDPVGCGKKPEQRSNAPELRNYGAYPTFDEIQRAKWVLHRAKQEDLNNILVSPWCVSDHMLGTIQEGLYYLQRHCKPAVAKS